MAFNLLPVGPRALPASPGDADRIKERYDYVSQEPASRGMRHGHVAVTVPDVPPARGRRQLSTGAAAQSAGPASAAAAPAPAEAAAPAKRFTVTTGLDFTSAYLFRGIPQKSGGAIGQPYADLGIALGPGRHRERRHLEQRRTRRQSAGNWYESDYYASVTFTAGKLKPGCCTPRTRARPTASPRSRSWPACSRLDDSASPFPLSPKVVLAFELGDGQADGGEDKGTYLELGIRPTVKLAPESARWRYRSRPV